jgi:hypothetical protein
MISSEVKRTLVKSPPELWSELSDPAALARHLGEFGEIRITRSEPEQLVEWEGDRASGRVVLKPSGWGTKVTLTVSGELAEGAAKAHLDEPSPAVTTTDSEPEAPQSIAAPSEPSAAPTAVELPSEPPAAELPSEPPAVGVPPEPSGVADLADPEAEWEAEREPELIPPPHSAAAIAAEVAAESLTSSRHPEPIREPVAPFPTADAALESAPAMGGDAAESSPRSPGPQAAPEARRGFFARLFGRGAAEPAARNRSEPIAHPGPAALPGPTAPPLQIAHPEPAAPEPIATAPPEPPPLPEPIATPEPIAAAIPEPSPLPEPTTPPNPAPPVSALTEPEATLERAPDVDVAGEPFEGEGSEAAGEVVTTDEVAAEQVEMVLTSVLDRLGSAHHRPFSRS